MVRLMRLPFLKWKLVLVTGDAVCYGLGVVAALVLNPHIGLKWWPFWVHHWFYFVSMGCCYPVVFVISDLYDYQQNFLNLENLGRLFFACLTSAIVIIVIFYFPMGNLVGRTQLVLQSILVTVFVALWRIAFSSLPSLGILQQRLLIIGAGRSGRRLLEALRKRPLSGFQPLGFVDDDPKKIGSNIDDLPVLGDSWQLQELIRQYKITLVVVAITHDKSPALLRVLFQVCLENCQVMDMPNFYEFLTGKIPIEHISDIRLFLQNLANARRPYQYFKRLFDLVVSTLGLLLTLPLFAIIALAIRYDSQGPVFFSQERVGKGGRIFRILKFRTMINGNGDEKAQFASVDDPRITKVGKVLRRYRLDELPQLVNILKGEMSFIGPRPEQVEFVKYFQEPFQLQPYLRRWLSTYNLPVVFDYSERIPYYSYRLLVRPGITGWAQVKYPYASTLEQTWEKVKHDLYYIKNMGFLLDLIIILKTIRVVLLGRGV
jgi:exopolysaccharide biosynthesis polyprenyl glycosylphosphotransferase